MNKKHRQAIEDSLSSALEPPKRKPSPALNEILSQFAPTPTELEPTPHTPPTPRTPPTDATHPIAPARDFTRVANSIVRDVVPSGHFIGKSKQLYDYLYQMTRGAVVPTRRLTTSKPALMRASGIGSERTLLKNLNHLKSLGLIQISYTDGKHEGNTYEVFLPEEVGLPTQRTPPTPPTAGSTPHPRAEVPPVQSVDSGVRGVGSAPIDSMTSGQPKTSFKTNTEQDDDEAFAGFAAAMKKAVREVTGKEPSAAEMARWTELAEVLTTELKIATGRTTVSSVPAFLAEHLRRRLWKKEKRQIEAEAAERKTVVAPKVDVSKCPDCFGAGMYYPEGFDKGVARCDHKRLPEIENQRGQT
jgi:hypothetical protein